MEVEGQSNKPPECSWSQARESFLGAICTIQALTYLTFNLKTSKNLANGVPVKYHSISFFDKEDQVVLEQQLACDCLPKLYRL